MVLKTHQSQRVLVRVIVNANKRLSIRLKGTPDGRYTLRLHWALLNVHELDAMVLEALHTNRFPRNIDRVLNQLGATLGEEHVYGTSEEQGPIVTRGLHIDLEDVLHRVQEYLPAQDQENIAPVRITWGKRNKTPSRRSIRLGSMDERRGLIRIHPTLDSAAVPLHVVDFVVWHELCHHIRPPLSKELARATSDNRIHHRAFRALEARFPAMEAAERWIHRNLDDLLRGKITF